MLAYLLLFYIMGGIECLLLIPFLFRFKLLDKGGKWMFYYLLSSLLFSFGSVIIAHIWRNNMWFFSIMYVVQFAILSRFFHIVIKNPTVKIIITVILVPVSIIFLADSFKLEGLYAYNSYLATVKTFILLVYGAIYFWQLLRDYELVKSAVFINTLPDFWYNAGLFIYHSGSFMFFLTYNLVQQTRSHENLRANTVTLGISYAAAIIQLILIYIGLEKAKKMRS